MRRYLSALAAVALVAGCGHDPGEGAVRSGTPSAAMNSPGWTAVSPRPRPAPVAAARLRTGFASLPDRGALLAYDTAVQPRRTRAYTFHPVSVSEEHALRAIATGTMDIPAPDGSRIRLRYAGHTEHPDGNWTWVGRRDGDQPGMEAIITFGEKAVFGTIPYGDREPLRIAMANGRSWLIDTDRKGLASLDHRATDPTEPDFVPASALPRVSAERRAATAGAARTASALGPVAAAAPASATVDVVLGYTSAFATRLGGQSQANTRLAHLIAVTNQAYVNSQINAAVRLVRTVQVSYPDNTANEDALYDITGVSCTEDGNGNLSCKSAPVPAALQPLIDAREQYGADLVSLVRNFHDPENDGCGIAWLNGAGQRTITSYDADGGFSVVSDSNLNQFPDDGYICRDETLAHELGHNMGSAHDRDQSDGDDNVLQSDEYGRYAYSFGYKTTAGNGNFYTVMAYGDSGQTRYRVFSNPDITYCGGRACGIDNQADNARSLGQTIPIVATFRAMVVPLSRSKDDFNGDGIGDVVWRNGSNGGNVLWLGANAASHQVLTAVGNLAWAIRGIGDFDGDGEADLLWRNESTGQNSLWPSGNSAASLSLASVAGTAWRIVAIGDFGGDGRADILWRNTSTGGNTIWHGGDHSGAQAIAAVGGSAWVVAGAGDFNGDAVDDVLWRNTATGANVYWPSGNSAAQQILAAVPDQRWSVVAIADFNGDGQDDLFWRHSSDGRNSLWLSANASTQQTVSAVGDAAWRVVAAADYDGDGADDLFWRNTRDGRNVIWRSANSATTQAVTTVGNLAWSVQ